MRDKYNLNTLPPSLAGLEDYEMDEHISIPGMGSLGGIPSVNDDRFEYGDQQNSLKDHPNFSKPAISLSNAVTVKDHSGIPGLDLDVSSVRDKSLTSVRTIPLKPVQNEMNVGPPSDNYYGITACDSASILACIRDILPQIINRLPGICSLNEIQPEKLQIYGKEINIIREFSVKHSQN